MSRIDTGFRSLRSTAARVGIASLACMAFFWAVLASADGGNPILLEERLPAEDLKRTNLLADVNSRAPFDASGVTLLSQIAVEDFPGANIGANDIWGYVSPSGREYALVGLEKGTAFVEVTNPAAPAIVGFVPHIMTCCSDIKVYQEYAYVVNESNAFNVAAGMQVIDLSGVDAGVVTLVNTFSAAGLTQAHNLAINEESGFAYVLGSHGNISDGGLFVLDLLAPANPIVAGAWSDRFVHDAQVVTYTTGPYAGREIAFAYTGLDVRLRIIDVTDKAAMVEIGSTIYPNGGYSHQGWLSKDRKHVFLNDEFDELSSGVPTTTYVINVEDLTQPTFVSSFTNGLTSTDHNLTVRGNFVFEANYTSGLRIYDVSNLSSVGEVGFFDTHPADDDPGFTNGAWGVYADLPSGILLVSDFQGGLFVLDPMEAFCIGEETIVDRGDRLELTIPDPVDLGEPIQWRKNGAPLSDDGRITGTNSRTLIIDPLEYGDTGSYAAYYDDGVTRAFATFCAITLRVGPLPASGMMGLALLACIIAVAAAFILGSRS